MLTRSRAKEFLSKLKTLLEEYDVTIEPNADAADDTSLESWVTLETKCVVPETRKDGKQCERIRSLPFVRYDSGVTPNELGRTIEGRQFGEELENVLED